MKFFFSFLLIDLSCEKLERISAILNLFHYIFEIFDFYLIFSHYQETLIWTTESTTLRERRDTGKTTWKNREEPTRKTKSYVKNNSKRRLKHNERRRSLTI